MSVDTDSPAIDTGDAPPDVLPDGMDHPSNDPGPQSWTRRVRLSIDRIVASGAPLWRDRRIGAAVAAAVPLLWGVTAARWTPRGPLITSEAVWSIVISLAVGAIAGCALRSRWAMLVTPVVFVLAFEAVRMDTVGPTVDRVEMSTYGVIAFIVGRGFHALISLLPLLFGATVGAGIARSAAAATSDVPVGRSAWRMIRRTMAIVAGIGLVVFTLVLSRPASTARIVDADGRPIPDSVAELTTVDVNGHDLHLMIRGHGIDNPVVLFLAGGPGGSELGAMRRHLDDLEQEFTVVTWDQRGTGKSYPALDPVSTITLDGFIDDTIAVTDHLRDRFGQERIFLLGQSWGTTLGVLAVQQRPEMYEAFVGVGQMVSPLETDRIFYADTLDWARNNGDDDLVENLLAIGPPPYERMLNYELALANEQEVYPYDHSPNSEGEGQMSENLLVEEYTLIDQVHVLGAFMDTFSVLYPQLQDIDFRATATEFETPLFFVQGAHEAGGRAELFDEWYPMVDAPIKDLAVFDTSGHRPLWEQPDDFVRYMTDTVLAQVRRADR